MKLKEYILATFYKHAGKKVDSFKSGKKVVHWAILKSFYWLPEDQRAENLLEQFHGPNGIFLGTRGLCARDANSGTWDLKTNFAEYYRDWSANPDSLRGYLSHMSQSQIASRTRICAISGLRFHNNSMRPLRVAGQPTVWVQNDVAQHQNPRLYWVSDEHYEDEPEFRHHGGHWSNLPPPPPRPRYGQFLGYHSGVRTWNHSSADDEIANNKLYGVELEICAKKDRNDICRIAGEHELLSESDGSLDGTYGVEIIGKPLTFEQIKAKDGQWLKFLEAIRGKAKGYTAGGGRDYGMHISVNRLHLEQSHSARLMVFVHRNQNLCEHVARRQSCSWCRFDESSAKSYIDRDQNEGERYHALAVRGRKRLEMRIFRSNIKPESFMRNVEFLDACLEYTRGATVSELTVHLFLFWLNKKKTLYPNLHKDLCGGKKFIGSLNPPWTKEWAPETPKSKATTKAPAKPRKRAAKKAVSAELKAISAQALAEVQASQA